MPADARIKRVGQQDWDVVKEFSLADVAAAKELAKLAQDPDEEVREIALYCLASIAGEVAQQSFLGALTDSSQQIQDCGANFLLSHHHPKMLPPLMQQLAGNPSDYVRVQVALVIGKIGDPGVVAELEQRLEHEADAAVEESIGLALARLGQPEQLEQALAPLQSQEMEPRLQALRSFEYIGRPELSHLLGPALADTRDAVNVAPAGHGQYIRVCDVTINTLAVVHGDPFLFEIDRMRRYEADEMEAARALVSRPGT